MNNQKKEGFLERLRAKPLSYRRNFALGVSLGITLVLMSVWAIATTAKLSSPNENLEATASVSNSLSTFSLIKEQFSVIFSSNPFSQGEIINKDIQPSVEQAGSDPQYLVQ